MSDINNLITRLRDIAWDFPPEHSINRAADMLTMLKAENNKLQDELKYREAEIARLNKAREIANEKAREYEKRAGLVEQKRKSDMKRLTIRNSDGTVSQPTTTSIEALFYRLAAYEDTGLEPEEIITGKELTEIACGLELLKKYQEIGNFDRLRELAEADKEGRCAVLPVEVGQSVYFINRAFDSEICTAIVIGAEINLYTPSCPIWIRIEWFSKRTGKHEYHSRADLIIGKTVFLTREAAETALKERERNE